MGKILKTWLMAYVLLCSVNLFADGEDVEPIAAPKCCPFNRRQTAFSGGCPGGRITAKAALVQWPNCTLEPELE